MASELTSRSTGQAGTRPMTAPIIMAPAASLVLGRVALGGIGLTLLVFAALHLLPPTSDISPVHRTISEYALTSSAWAFNLGVISLAVASVAVIAALVLQQRAGPVSAATVFGALWVAGLLTLVSFPKHNWALGTPSSTGQIHRMASLVAFLALPIAVLALSRRHAGSRRPRAARWAAVLAVLSLLWFSPIVIAILTAPRAWWQAIPLGLVERGLALTEVLALVALAVLVLRTGPHPSPSGGDQLPSRGSTSVETGHTGQNWVT